MTPEQIKDRDAFPYLSPLKTNGRQVFPQADTTVPSPGACDLDFDLPEAFIPEFPPAILSNRPELGDVSRGEVVAPHNSSTFGESSDSLMNRILQYESALESRLRRSGLWLHSFPGCARNCCASAETVFQSSLGTHSGPSRRICVSLNLWHRHGAGV